MKKKEQEKTPPPLFQLDSKFKKKSLPLTLPFHSFLLKLLENKGNNTHSVGEVVNRIAVSKKQNLKKTWTLSSQITQIQNRALGFAMHRVFELLKFYDIAEIKSILHQLADTEENKEKLSLALDYLSEQHAPNVLSLATKGHAEWGFTFQLQNHSIVGKIDLWGRDSQDQLWIIDYKTGSVSMSYENKAKLQLKMYALALLACKEAKQKESFNLLLLYPEQRKKKLFTYTFKDLFAEEIK